MNRSSVLAAVVASFAVTAGRTPDASAAACAVVSAQDAHVVDVIDCGVHAVTHRIPVGDLPVGLTVDASAQRLYVTRPEAGAITVVDLARCRATAGFEGLGMPFATARWRGWLLVTDWAGDRLLALDADNGRILAGTTTGRAPAGLAVDPERGRVYVAERESDTLGVFALPQLERIGGVAVGEAPFAVVLDGGRPIVVDVRSGTVSVIDPDALAVAATIPVGHMPYAAAVAGSRVVVTNQQSGTLSLLERGAIPRSLGETKVGSYPEGVAIVEGGYAVVADWFSDDVRLVDPATGATIATIATDSGPRVVAAVDGRVCGQAAAGR